jgi:hypothetical protein
VPGCTHKHEENPIYFRPRCHPKAGFSVGYFDGEIILRCMECGESGGNILVALG